MAVVVKIICASDDSSTPHDGRYVVRWNPHVEYGTFEATSTPQRAKAKRFPDHYTAIKEWDTISSVQPVRPDGAPNKPLKGVTILLELE